jgi:hypothetical protein
VSQDLPHEIKQLKQSIQYSKFAFFSRIKKCKWMNIEDLHGHVLNHMLKNK